MRHAFPGAAPELCRQPPFWRWFAALTVMALLASPAAKGGPPPAEPESADLSPAAIRVSRIADRNGDRHYVMIDKSHGRLIVFRDGRPVLHRAVLTGESLADQLPPDAIFKTSHEQVGVRYKVTPAGRYTVVRGHDPGLGETFDIAEIHGKDWTIAIHQVWLGNRAEHRDARLRSAGGEDKHITYGCIDVDADTMRDLLHLIGTGTPLYVLPNDESQIDRLFQVRESATRGRPPAG